LQKLVALAERAQTHFAAEFGLDLGLICIDTVAAAAGWRDENDNAQAQLAMNVMRELSSRSGAFVMAVDHFGKDASTGTRGASAKEAAADVVLATLGDRKEDGSVEDTRLVVRKMRSGPSGLVLPFAKRQVPMGMDEHHRPVTTLVIDWNVVRPQKPKAKAGRPRIVPLGQVVEEAVTNHGEIINANGAGGVKAVRKDKLRGLFEAIYVDEKPRASGEAMRAAFRRELDRMGATLQSAEIDGTEYVWLNHGPI
jgi:hypothetical protein